MRPDSANRWLTLIAALGVVSLLAWPAMADWTEDDDPCVEDDDEDDDDDDDEDDDGDDDSGGDDDSAEDDDGDGEGQTTGGCEGESRGGGFVYAVLIPLLYVRLRRGAR